MAFLSFFLSWVQLFDRVIFLIFFVLSLFGPVVSFSKIRALKFFLIETSPCFFGLFFQVLKPRNCSRSFGLVK